MKKSSTQKTTDGSDFLPGKMAIWEGYSRYESDSKGVLVILIKNIEPSNPIREYFDDKQELRWFCFFLDKPGEPVILRKSELKIV